MQQKQLLVVRYSEVITAKYSRQKPQGNFGGSKLPRVNFITFDSIRGLAARDIAYHVDLVTASPSFRPVRSPKLQIVDEMFRLHLKSPEYKRHIGVPRANIRDLIWLSSRLIISTENTDIYMSIFPNALTSKRDQNREISIYFSTNSIVALCHAPP